MSQSLNDPLCLKSTEMTSMQTLKVWTSVPKGVDEDWTAFRDVVYKTALKQHQDWFDENDSDIQALPEGKRHAFRAHQPNTIST